MDSGSPALSSDPASPDAEPVPLTRPAEGVPAVVETLPALRAAVTRLAAGHGPYAVDTERASGYRYSQRAYLVQLRREGAGSVLVDPIPLGSDIAVLGELINGADWVLHAASQDLPCLAELDLRPGGLFDTELAGRLCGFERVALGALVERLLGYRLEKGHGAADWSRRPLPEEWLSYAALDVELLIELRNRLEKELVAQDKLDWALEEFEAVRTAPPPGPRAEPWRRTSGIHKLRSPRQYAAARALWQARDGLARQRDIAPGRVLPDAAIVEAALNDPPGERELLGLPVFRGRAQRRQVDVWAGALREARVLAKADLPDPSPPHDGPPPPNRWAERDPAAAARLQAARAALTERAKGLRMPVENMLQPELVRRLCWQPPEQLTEDAVREALAKGGARNWQIGLASGLLTTALGTKPANS
ncbi:HRDC domain-containing protein [Allokutzneria sp. A3M-2-11 16]|uniref:HRDC domain-containing protein n=1 Tax=Allokutzneria sp. A3M-2-11 16 TaxID=2962043 RepID=UPI0020B7A766|nr:HRDC domain-containing protein [Allokutzneria sp. A3M-2-11 16]MCP3804528.1 HRDC domain-containing protein [Allokutzneria sp. A3M-2-11 16]